VSRRRGGSVKAAMLRLLFRVFYADLLRSMALDLVVEPSCRFQHILLRGHMYMINLARTSGAVIGADLAGPTLLRHMVIFIHTPAAPMSDGLLICAGFFVQCIICLG
jgi:hypothetical protein